MDINSLINEPLESRKNRYEKEWYMGWDMGQGTGIGTRDRTQETGHGTRDGIVLLHYRYIVIVLYSCIPVSYYPNNIFIVLLL